MQSAQFQLHARVEESHWWFTGRRKIMRELVRQIVPPEQRPTVVDVGCGTGANLASMAREYTCVGIDTSREAIELARSRFPGVRFISGRAPDDLGRSDARGAIVLAHGCHRARPRRFRVPLGAAGRLDTGDSLLDHGAGESVVLVEARREQRTLPAVRTGPTGPFVVWFAGHDTPPDVFQRETLSHRSRGAGLEPMARTGYGHGGDRRETAGATGQCHAGVDPRRRGAGAQRPPVRPTPPGVSSRSQPRRSHPARDRRDCHQEQAE